MHTHCIKVVDRVTKMTQGWANSTGHVVLPPRPFMTGTQAQMEDLANTWNAGPDTKFFTFVAEPVPEFKAPEPEMWKCGRCGKRRTDVEDRYSFGIYAGRLCTPCCGSYRDNCGVGRAQGNPYAELDEQIDPI